MILRILVFALIAYLAWKFLLADLRRRFAAYQPPSPGRVTAVETVQCPRCGIYVAEGVTHECAPTGND